MNWLEKCDKYNLDDFKNFYEDKNKSFGISIYPDKSNVDELKKYIDLAAKYNIKWIFTNLLSDGTRTKEEIVNQFKEIIEYGNSKGLSTILDVAPNVYKMLDLKHDDLDFFKNIGAKGIRLDEFFGGETEAKLLNNKDNLIVEINASQVEIRQLVEKIKANKGNLDNLTACHNFYPQRYTGLSLKIFNKTSKYLKSENIRTKAFVHTNNKDSFGPWDVFEGLPSIEECRNISISAQSRLLLGTNLIDDILVSDCFATEDDFKSLKAIDPNIINFGIKLENKVSDLEKEIIFDFPHALRPDMSDYMIRSTFPRITFKDKSIAPNNTVKKLVKGDVVVLNDNYGRYKGELHIVTQDMDNDGGKNLVGKLEVSDHFVLDNIIDILLENEKPLAFNIVNIN